tara:strand:- start:12 stop:317 length:306 start_codon:yes stop_codon:yes gene_type:complete
MKKIILFLLIILFHQKSFAEDKMKLGLEVYKNKAMCGTCHTLQAAESIGDIGPNLDKLKPQIPQIIYAVTNGIGVMQSWSDVLSVEEIEAVAYYIFMSTNK